MKRVLIIAEAGVNHNGDINTAKKLVREAKRCGADIVKFQTFNPRKLASSHAVMADYQKENRATGCNARQAYIETGRICDAGGLLP